jgi:uncharacterized protein YjbI with pentapeptide repeats
LSITAMAIDPKDVGELQKALNDASGKASALWIAFVTFELYVAIAFGSVTHRNLFLEDPIKLPVLNVDLPLVGFFVVAPVLLVIFHFYVFLQLLALARKAGSFDTLLAQAAAAAPADGQVNALAEPQSDQYVRHRLDSFLILQFLCGPADQRSGNVGTWLRLIAWITLVGAPTIILLQGQVTFLPYHLQWAQWLLRVCILVDLVVVWLYWDPLRNEDAQVVRWIPPALWRTVGGVATGLIVIFSICLATFPGELLARAFPAPPPRALLFEGEVDEVSGRPERLFSNRLIVTNQSFVDPDKLDKVEVSRSFRGRDLRRAVLNGADLRKADFTGAIMIGVEAVDAKLQDARFGCAFSKVGDGDTLYLACADLQGANLGFANLEGADFRNADLRGADLEYAGLQGAQLGDAQLTGAVILGARLQGADLVGAALVGANLTGARLQAADLKGARLQAAWLDLADMQGARLTGAAVWHVRAGAPPDIELAELDKLDMEKKPWDEGKFGAGDAPLPTIVAWRDNVLNHIKESATRQRVRDSLSPLDPDGKASPDTLFWKWPTLPKAEDRTMRLADLFADLVCSGESGAYVARAMLRTDFLASAGKHISAFADKLRKGKTDQVACPGVTSFREEDWAALNRRVSQVLKEEADKDPARPQK